MGDAFIRCRRLSACAVVVAQLFATGFVVSHCHGDEHGGAEWHWDGHEHSHGCHNDHRHNDHRHNDHQHNDHQHNDHQHNDHQHEGHQHEGHQHAPGSGGGFERHEAAAGRGGSAESTPPLQLSRDVVAVADELASLPGEAGLQRRVAREAADAVRSVRDLRPHVLKT
ncbi:MAG: hypothetical protein O3A60_00230 [Planctomycetota bacterium]|nr:hypothetical protein [Planctomycetota bacterium]